MEKDSNYYKTFDVKSDQLFGISQYAYSKLWNIYFTQYLHEYSIKNNLNVTTASLHPGVINTELVRDYRNILLD